MSTEPLMRDTVPADPREESWDVVVVGCGMGGSTVGHALAQRGRKVLFLEKGDYLFGEHERSGDLQEPEDPEDRLRQGKWPFRVNGQVNGRSLEMFAPLGCGTGGSSSLFAAQLERMLPGDFEPSLYYGNARESSAPDQWPLAYAALVPYYRAVEQLYEVSGTADPYNPDPEQRLRAPPPHSLRDAELMQQFAAAGLHPYHAHVGCRYVAGCTGCGGVLCARRCKSDAGRVCLLPALADHGAKLVSRADVTHVEARDGRIERVHYRKDGEATWVRARYFVLAAGALMTPALLLRSATDDEPLGVGNRSAQIGRNLMMHASDFVALQLPTHVSADGPGKALSFNDLYVHEGVKLGTVQSVGMPVNAGVIQAFLKSRSERAPHRLPTFGRLIQKIAAHVGARIFRSATVLATIIEDLPYAENRIVLDAGTKSGMRFDYRYPDELLLRCERMRAQLRHRLPDAVAMLVLSGDQNLNFGHVSGTCRMGLDPETSALDATQRFHDLENLYVADASAFPTSGGINPSLTIAATALRVADVIDRQLPVNSGVAFSASSGSRLEIVNSTADSSNLT